MSELYSVILTEHVYKKKSGVSFTGYIDDLLPEAREWLNERGTQDTDWAFDSSMTIVNGKFVRRAFITFMDEDVALEFKLRWS